MPSVTSKVLPMSPVHLLPMSPVYTKGDTGGFAFDFICRERSNFVERTSETPQNRRFPCFLPLSRDESCSEAYCFIGSLKKSGVILLDCRRQIPGHCREQSVSRWFQTKKNQIACALCCDWSTSPLRAAHTSKVLRLRANFATISTAADPTQPPRISAPGTPIKLAAAPICA